MVYDPSKTMDKRAFLVLGPESSGTRLMTKLLMVAGCYGDDGHVQRLDRDPLPNVPRLVWRRSVPHGKQWPDLSAAIQRLQRGGYVVTVVVTSRDWHAMALSQIEQTHAPDVAGAIRNVQWAYHHIFRALYLTHVPFEVVNYEALVSRPQAVTAQLMTRLGLPAPAEVSIYDGNAKYYAEVLA